MLYQGGQRLHLNALRADLLCKLGSEDSTIELKEDTSIYPHVFFSFIYSMKSHIDIPAGSIQGRQPVEEQEEGASL